jgi:sugar/nucleoside kinase (ribokinase family)
MRPSGILCAGNIVYDILVRPVEDIRWGATTWVESIEQSIGGNGANTCYCLARLGVPVRLASMLGPDSFGSLLLDLLRAVGVDTAWIGRGELPTPTSIALVRSSGERMFLHRPGAAAEVLPDPMEFTPDLTAGFSHFHLANAYALPKMRKHAAETLRRARAAGLTTSLDTGWDSRGEWMQVIGPCLPSIDLLFANEDEAKMLTGAPDAARAAAIFRERGAGAVVIKLGGSGCAVFTPEGEFLSPAFAVDVVDTTGAGDSFVGGFLAALHYGKSLEDCASFANAVGALSVSRLGATNGLLNLEDTERFLRQASVA